MLNLGIVGTSKLVDNLKFLKNQNIGIRVIAISGRNVERVKNYSEYFNCLPYYNHHELITNKDIQIIYINLPDGLHDEYCSNALKYNKHIICEKSFGVNFNSVQNIVNVANKRKLYLFESFMVLYHEQYKLLENYIDSKKLGSLINLTYFNTGYFNKKKNYRFIKDLGGGIINDLGCYVVNLYLKYSKEKIKKINADFIQNAEDEVETTGIINIISEKNFFINGMISYSMPTNLKLIANFQYGKITFYNPSTSAKFTKVKLEELNNNILKKNINLKQKLILYLKKIINNFFYFKRNNVKNIKLKSDNPYKLMLESFVKIILEKKDYKLNNKNITKQAKLMQELRLHK